jgi:uncharacterized protein
MEDIHAAMKLHHVKDAYAFGSVCSNEFNEKSDIDVLVSFKDMKTEEYADNYFALLYLLQDILKREVDLVTDKSLKNPYFIKSVNLSKKLIYE